MSDDKVGCVLASSGLGSMVILRKSNATFSLK